MRRFMTVLGVALLGYALLPSSAQAQVIVVPPYRTYSAPVFVAPPVVQSYYYATPSVTTVQPNVTYSYYPSTTVFSAPAAPIVTYSAPAVMTVPAAGVITTRSGYGYGIFRPRGYYTESYYTPLR